MKILIMVFLLFAATSSHAEEGWIPKFDKWTRGDIVRQSIFIGLVIVDWRQTYYISESPEKFEERNTILGKHPDKKSIDRYHIIATLLHTALIHVAPQKWREPLQYISIALEGETVIHNARIGIQINW